MPLHQYIHQRSDEWKRLVSARTFRLDCPFVVPRIVWKWKESMNEFVHASYEHHHSVNTGRSSIGGFHRQTAVQPPSAHDMTIIQAINLFNHWSCPFMLIFCSNLASKLGCSEVAIRNPMVSAASNTDTNRQPLVAIFISALLSQSCKLQLVCV